MTGYLIERRLITTIKREFKLKRDKISYISKGGLKCV